MKETWCHLSGVKGVGAPSFRIGVGVESSDVVKKKDLAGGEYVRLKNSALPLLLLSLALGVKVRRGRNTGTVVRRVEEGIRIQAEKEKPEEDGKLQRRHGIGGGVEAKRQVSGWARAQYFTTFYQHFIPVHRLTHLSNDVAFLPTSTMGLRMGAFLG